MSKTLSRSRLIKNHRLAPVIELYSIENSGSGQIDWHAAATVLELSEAESEHDMAILANLASLHSFDVYSLRITLRTLGLEIDDIDALRLSPEKQAELTRYMTKFTRPLISQIYGDNQTTVNSFQELLDLFRKPNKKEAINSLKRMAQALNIDIMEVPNFLEDFADVFLGLSYYRHCLDSIDPMLKNFVDSLDLLRNNWQVSRDRNLLSLCNSMETTLNELARQVAGLLNNFDAHTTDMLNDLTSEKFRRLQLLIDRSRVVVGGILCALWVKVHGWFLMFPNQEAGGPVRRAEFIRAEMRLGLDRIREIMLESQELHNISI